MFPAVILVGLTMLNVGTMLAEEGLAVLLDSLKYTLLFLSEYLTFTKGENVVCHSSTPVLVSSPKERA